MPRSPNILTSPKTKSKHDSDKIKIDNTIQAARLIKNTANNSMMNTSDSSSTLVYDDNMYNNTDVGWTQVSKRNHLDSFEPNSPDPTLNISNIKKKQ